MFWRPDITQEAGPAKVLLKRGEFVDDSRTNDDGSTRVIPFKVYHPVYDEGQEQQCPVIIWSHGYGGNRDGASFLSRFLASYGYIIVHLTHIGTDSSLWEGKEGHPWDVLRQTKISRSTTLNRFMDVPYVLDQLPSWVQDYPEIAALADLNKLGMSGHSFGALTTQVMAGQNVPNDEGDLMSLKEKRFTAGVLYSPVPVFATTKAEGHDVYGSITLPLMHMTGTQDTSPLESFDYDHRFTIYNETVKADKYLLVKQGGDHMVYNGTRGKLDANPNRELHEDIIKMTALAFWDAWLKEDEAAHDWLVGEGLQTYINGNATFKYEEL